MADDTGVLIGSGGMGEVFRVWNPELQRWEARKYLRYNSPELVERLFREARAQARLHHPSICEIYEVGEEDGRPFIAMQYVEGRPLLEAAAEMSLEEKALVMKKVVEAVQAAHAAGLIHRDLKPGNILVEEKETGEPHPYILDFGIAREQDVEGLTVSGHVIGTPGYTSPEQARGETSTLDRRTDIFSLGVILYELLAGQRPFAGDSGVQVLLEVLQSEPMPLKRQTPGVPRDLATIVMTCLEKDPERRYPSARALARDLESFLDGEPITARPRGALSRLAAKARTYPRTTALAALSLATVLLMAGLALQARREAAQREEKAQEFGQEVERMEGVLQRAYVLPLHDVRPEMEQVRERIAWIDAEMDGLGVRSQALGHYAAGRGHLALGEAERASQRLQQAWDLGYSSPRVAYALGLALALRYQRALEEASGIRNAELRESQALQARETLADPAQSYLEQSRGGSEHPGYLAATLAFFGGEYDTALNHLRQLKDTQPYFYQGDLLAGAVHRRNYEELGQAGDEEGRTRAFQEALASFAAAATVGESDPRPYEETCGLWVAELRYQHWSRSSDPEPAMEGARQSCDEALVADPGSVRAHIEAGRAHRFWASQESQAGRDPSEALAAARKHAWQALEGNRENVEAYVLLGVTHRIAASAQADQGVDPQDELMSAIAAYDEAILIRPADYGANMSLAHAQLTLGDWIRLQGGDPTPQFQAAADSAGRATQHHPGMVGGWVNLGIAYGQLGILARDQGTDASPWFEKGVAALERAIEVNPGFYTAHFNLGEMLIGEAEGVLKSGGDPLSLVTRALPLLEESAQAFQGWAPPHFLMAQGWALVAEHARIQGDDPGPLLTRAEESIAAGRTVRDTDARGLTLASLTHLVAGRWLLQMETDPEIAVAQGLEMIDLALEANPTLGPAWLRRGELLLIQGVWKTRNGLSPERDLSLAQESIEKAVEINSAEVSAHTTAAELWRLRGEEQKKQGEAVEMSVKNGLESVSQALAIDPENAEALAHQAALERLVAEAP